MKGSEGNAVNEDREGMEEGMNKDTMKTNGSKQDALREGNE